MYIDIDNEQNNYTHNKHISLGKHQHLHLFHICLASSWNRKQWQEPTILETMCVRKSLCFWGRVSKVEMVPQQNIHFKASWMLKIRWIQIEGMKARCINLTLIITLHRDFLLVNSTSPDFESLRLDRPPCLSRIEMGKHHQETDASENIRYLSFFAPGGVLLLGYARNILEN